MKSLLEAPAQYFRLVQKIFLRYDVAILLSVAGTIILYLWVSPVRVHNLTLEDSQSPEKGEFEISNSYRAERKGTPQRTLIHRAQFEYNIFSQDLLHVRTLDCHDYIRLNGKDLNPYIVSGNLCDDYNGAYFDISDFAVSGENFLELKTRHNRSEHILFFGFHVKSANLKSPTYLAFALILFGIVFYFVATRLIKSRLPAYALIILLAAIFLRVYVVSNTHALERSHDVHGHIEYMNILIEDRSLPKKDRCWSCYHPPYYFATMAAAKAFLMALGVTEFTVYQFLMLGSVLIYSVCLYFAFLTIGLFFSGAVQRIFAMGLFSFLPSSVIHSVAINNDLWMFTLFTIAFYYFIRWWQSKVTGFYYISLMFAVLSVLVKANGIVMFALLGFYALGYALTQYERFFVMVRRFAPAAIIMCIALFVNPMVDSMFRPPSNNTANGIISNAGGLSSGLIVGNEAEHYLKLDVVNFINRPFVHPLDDASGRQYFWETLLKTALYGEFRDFHAHNVGSHIRNSVGPVISLAFLMLLAYMIIHAFLMRKENMSRYGPLYALLATGIIALILIRSALPYFPMNDFRYIWTVMLAPCILVPLSLEVCYQQDRPMLAYIGYGATAMSILLSVLFCISMS